MEDVILNKVAFIERCLNRIREEVERNKNSWKGNFTIQDSILLNLQRACEASIDLANHVIKTRKLGIPQTSRDSFDLLLEAALIDPSLATKMKHMVGFRNIAAHEYQTLNLDVIESIIKNHLSDFQTFTAIILKIK
jgi:uncharacterized protein YutE (UPF0331/DUF86 family)